MKKNKNKVYYPPSAELYMISIGRLFCSSGGDPEDSSAYLDDFTYNEDTWEW